MVSRVPGYGRFEYLVFGLSCESRHVTLLNDDALMGLSWSTLLNV